MANITGTSGNDVLNGTPEADLIVGLGGNDTLDGGAGNDSVLGDGDDPYVGGNDTLFGGIGDDRLERWGGDDTLYGGDGDDDMNGDFSFEFGEETTSCSAVPAMTASTAAAASISWSGEAGNDTYYVDDAGDVVQEAPAEGIDVVRSEVTFTLGPNIENLVLAERFEFDTQAINGTGNELDNTLTGQGGNNVITGLGGNDTIDGGDGTDTAAFSGDVTSYTFHKQFNPAINEDQITVSGPDGVDTLTRIELSSFTGPGFYNRFDPVNYLNQNPDVAAAGVDPLQHYLSSGAHEGRDPNANVHLADFNGEQYIASYPDLIVAFGDNPTAGQEHFLFQGVFGRARPVELFGDATATLRVAVHPEGGELPPQEELDAIAAAEAEAEAAAAAEAEAEHAEAETVIETVIAEDELEPDAEAVAEEVPDDAFDRAAYAADELPGQTEPAEQPDS